MATRRASWDISSQDLGLPENITFERIGIYSHLRDRSFFMREGGLVGFGGGATRKKLA